MAVPKSTMDIERGPQTGYPALGDWMAADPDGETLVFRKFSRLRTRTLLLLQSEVADLEAQSDALDREICSADAEIRHSVSRWETLIERAKDSNSLEWKYMELNMKIRVKLKEYHETLMLASSVAGLERPSSRVLRIFRDWFNGKTREQPWPIIAGKAQKMLADEDDLVALHVGHEKDTLTRLVQDHWFLEGKPGTSIHDSTRYFRRKHVSRTVALISTFFAATELVGAIVSLYFITDPAARLGIISAWTIAFGLSLRFLTSAKRAEIFASSAAFAAVLVVFVSGDLGGGGGNGSAGAGVGGGNITIHADTVTLLRDVGQAADVG